MSHFPKQNEFLHNCAFVILLTQSTQSILFFNVYFRLSHFDNECVRRPKICRGLNTNQSTKSFTPTQNFKFLFPLDFWRDIHQSRIDYLNHLHHTHTHTHTLDSIRAVLSDSGVRASASDSTGQYTLKEHTPTSRLD